MGLLKKLKIKNKKLKNMSKFPVPIFIISMKGSPRRELIQAHFASFGLNLDLDIVFFDGIEGRKNLKNLLNNSEEFSQQLSDGEVGCFRSHLAIAEKIMREKIPCALVLEDDVRVGDFVKLQAQINWLLSLLPSLHWDYIRLYHGVTVPKTVLLSKLFFNHQKEEQEELRLEVQHKSSRSNAALLISHKGAEKFFTQAYLSSNFFKFEPVDRYLDNIQRSGVDLLISNLGTLLTDENLKTQTHINLHRRYTKWQKLKNSLGRRWATWKMMRGYKKLIKKII